MQTKNTDKADPRQADPIKNDHKTSPRGMAPDAAHSSRGAVPGSRKNVEADETFESSGQNAGSRQTENRT